MMKYVFVLILSMPLTLMAQSDVIDPSFHPLFPDSLTKGAFFTIKVEAESYFHHALYVLNISRDEKGYFLSGTSKYDFSGEVIGSTKKTYTKVRLHKTQLDSLRIFEYNLSSNQPEVIDNNIKETYTFSMDGATRMYTDESANWNSMKDMLLILFRKKNK